MAKVKFFDTKNVITSLKGIGTSLVTSLVVLIPIAIARYFFTGLNMLMVGLVFGVLALGLYLLSWGYFAKKFWGWK